ncbi:hypothetical protein [uncultured Aquimarina sp.]|uniref:hypothetical protein n=1 Tax=uncultured Aquimarina sp. TaxID=575652 RepID=UPI0026058675|nr:hypothetical protein [uncultured Aquimarina sp.]
MRFLVEDIQLQLQLEATSAVYEHLIRSEVILNGKRVVNSSEKIVDVTILKKENKVPQIQVKTIEHNISLDNLLKKQEDITLKMASLSDTVLLGIDKKGLIKDIHNHHIIVQKWEVLQRELKELYEGNVMDQYLLGIRKKIEDKAKLLTDFQQPRLFGLLFDGLYGSYTTSNKAILGRIKTIYNTVDHIPVVIDESIYCDQIDTNSETITLRLKGRLNSEQTYINKIENHLIRKGVDKKSEFKLSSYDGIFHFNTNTGLLNTGSLVIETMFGEGYKKRDQLEMNIISA